MRTKLLKLKRKSSFSREVSRKEAAPKHPEDVSVTSKDKYVTANKNIKKEVHSAVTYQIADAYFLSLKHTSLLKLLLKPNQADKNQNSKGTQT